MYFSAVSPLSTIYVSSHLVANITDMLHPVDRVIHSSLTGVLAPGFEKCWWKHCILAPVYFAQKAQHHCLHTYHCFVGVILVLPLLLHLRIKFMSAKIRVFVWHLQNMSQNSSSFENESEQFSRQTTRPSQRWSRDDERTQGRWHNRKHLEISP